MYDLSGMKLVFDLRRNEELAKMTTKDKGDIDRESLFKSYETKDDVVWIKCKVTKEKKNLQW